MAALNRVATAALVRVIIPPSERVQRVRVSPQPLIQMEAQTPFAGFDFCRSAP